MAVVIVDGTKVVEEEHFLIRPPRQDFVFTYLHGISWRDVAGKPPFGEVWPRVSQKLEGVEFIAAHNAAFDRSVLFHCCHVAGAPLPILDFQCTVKLARQAWGIHPTTLPDVCRYLEISLQHHRADSDAKACAGIVIAAREQGLPLSPCLGKFRGWLPDRGPARPAPKPDWT